MSRELTSPLKWVGGKRKLAPAILDHVRKPTCLIEPFGGSLAFTCEFAKKFPGVPIIVSDALEPMILLWRHLRIQEVRSQIDGFERDYQKRSQAMRKVWYYEIRDEYTKHALQLPKLVDATLREQTLHAMSAMLFTMLRTCYNGMFRTSNVSGIFNTPAGFMQAKTMHDARMLDMFLAASKDWTITCRDYRQSIVDIVAGAFGYLDPPYKDTYDGYCGKVGFDVNGLAPFIRDCKKAGAKQVFMSQSYDPDFWHTALPEATHLALSRRQGVNRNVEAVGRPIVQEMLLMVS